MNEVTLDLNENSQGAFNIYEDSEVIAEMVVSLSDEAITVYHTEVSPEAEGRGLAKMLLNAMVEYAREQSLKVIPLCPYVLAQFKRHPNDYADIWLKEK